MLLVLVASNFLTYFLQLVLVKFYLEKKKNGTTCCSRIIHDGMSNEAGFYRFNPSNEKIFTL